MFSWLTGSGVLKDEQFEEDKEKLAEFYRDEGYIDFEIKDVQFDYTDPGHMMIRFIVSEGRQYHVGSIQFKGNQLFSAEEISKGRPKQQRRADGRRHNFQPQEAGRRTLRTSGISTEPRLHRCRGQGRSRSPTPNKGTVDLVYQIDGEEKGISRIEKIEIKGNTKTKDKVIRRELAVAPGEIFDMVRVKRSKGRLEQMRYFDKVETEMDPTGRSEPQEPDHRRRGRDDRQL